LKNMRKRLTRNINLEACNRNHSCSISIEKITRKTSGTHPGKTHDSKSL
jgi:hypothetical protein